MPIDASIPLQVKPIQLDNPLQQYGNVLAIQNAMNQNRLADLQYKQLQTQQADTEAVKRAYIEGEGDLARTKNALLRGGYHQQVMAIDEAERKRRIEEANVNEKDLKIRKGKLELFGGMLGELISRGRITFDDMRSLNERAKQMGILPDGIAASIPNNEMALQGYVRGLAFLTEQGRNAVMAQMPKPEKIDSGSQIGFVNVNPLAGNVGQQIGSAIGKSATPDATMTDTRTREQQQWARTNPTPDALLANNRAESQNWVVNADRGFTTHRVTGETRPLTIGGTNVGAKQRDTKPGERILTDGTIEVIPGSAEWTRRQNLHANDYGAVTAIDAKTDNAIRKLDYILDKKNEGAFNSNFGGYNAYITERLPGETQNVRNAIESLRSDLKSAGLELMRAGGSIGQMTQQEWPIVERMIANIDPRMSEEKARDELNFVKAYIERIRKNARDKYDTEWSSQRQFYKGGKEDKGNPSGAANTDAIKSALTAKGMAYEPEKYEYRVVDGKVQRKAK